jgi:TusA-related sulfurtransferase
MPHYDFPILPSTKVGALLDRYPELEDVLIGLAPPFKKLKNPFLRKGVAKVASLKHAAAVGGMPVNDLVNKLRAAVGQEAIGSENVGGSISYFSDQPEWFVAAKVVTTIDESAADPNKMPIVAVLQEAARLQEGEILELITTFLPAPGIEIMKRKGLRVWTVQQRPELIRTYVAKSPPNNDRQLKFKTMSTTTLGK